MVGICFSLESALADQGSVTDFALAAFLIIILIVVACVLTRDYSDRLVWTYKTGPFR
jgi:hypothetical protein